ncbi:hypothetical protein EVAR_62163_1 [Eumeta japonica]|uniref:Uncharacterized protein n=1 Tax=Eumeta variegata TaxID=151549 RepID=A0A4C1ZLJ2_EUMVA|nr:hypothetical protein EVAR_62163_1 [Eumeta japonica]
MKGSHEIPFIRSMNEDPCKARAYRQWRVCRKRRLRAEGSPIVAPASGLPIHDARGRCIALEECRSAKNDNKRHWSRLRFENQL